MMSHVLSFWKRQVYWHCLAHKFLVSSCLISGLSNSFRYHYGSMLFLLFGCMLGEPAHITLADDAKPYDCATARRVPLPMLQKVKDELQRMQNNGIIKPVTEPTDWCAPKVPVLKPNGSVRICVDLKRLNAHVKRENVPLPTVEDILSKLGKSKIFSTLDANS